MKILKIASLILVASLSLSVSAQGQALRLATWNVQWLADDILTEAQAKQCEAEAQAERNMDVRPTDVCRKGAPFRRIGAYVLMARHAKLIDSDIVALQEVQGIEAVRHLFDGQIPGDKGTSSLVTPGSYEFGVYSKGGWQKTAIAVRKTILAPGKHVEFRDFDDLGTPLTRDHRGAIEASVPLKNGETLHVLSIHLKSGCTTDNLGSAGANCPALALQAPILNKWIKAKTDAGEPFVIMGDFNRVLGAPVEACKHSDSSCRQAALGPWIDANDFAVPPIIAPTATLQHPIGCFDPKYGAPVIEHVVFGGGAEDGYVVNSVKSLQYLDSKTQQPITDHRRQSSSLSDHCVVTAEWRLK